ncbi:Response regulator containing a CheY-like receiver domain and a GGDEF domain [Hahella chejuensis KCTC 2396]|uniref:diguanylate cyclase n=1 Tax=Hahella chejuensis (strain KCTC 2396) TaxID=349521 RepID=Q2SGW4_HAHCH|nr:sensor domain-containing diguanylate cyclase [Hahella chejuensis]ABC30110.1 Response regulator containing a CheY-like receiver domain and a GGDEF domain [Hahella chejuensis KCTC 2396]
MKLRYLLVLAFTLVASLPLLFTLLHLNSFITEQYRGKIDKRLSEMSLSYKNNIRNSINDLTARTELISSRTQMRTSLYKWNQDKKSKELSLIRRIIFDAKLGGRNIESISIYDNQYNLVASTSSKAKELNTPDSFNGIQSVNIVAKEGAYYICISLQLVLGDYVIGIVNVSYPITEVIREATHLLGSTEQHLFAVRQDGDILLVLSPESKMASVKRLSWQDILDSTPIKEAMLGNERILRYTTDYKGEIVIASTRYLPELDWGVVVKINKEEVLSLINTERFNLFTIEAMIVLFSIGFGVAISSYISKPIDRLMKYTENLSASNVPEKENTTRIFEINKLTGRFNKILGAIDKLDKENIELKEMALRDPLTGIHNRRFFQNRLSYEFGRAKRYKSDLILVLLDIDKFKEVNDNKGHGAGDEVLIKLASFLKHSLRISDIVARIGGEEFCIILPEKLDPDVRSFIFRLHRDISLLEFNYINDPFHITCSMGVATLKTETRDPGEILKQADDALYCAKRTGRNRIIYEDELSVVVDISSKH